MEQTSQDTGEPQHESSLGVVGLLFGMLLLVGAVAGLAALGRPSPPFDGAAALGERFARSGPFPFGMQVVGSERELSGRELVRLEGPRAALEVAPAAAIAKPGKIDWDALPAAPGGEPARAALAWYPRKSAERVLRDQFTNLRFGSDGRGGMGGGMGGPPKAPDPRLQDAGTLTWAGYAAPFVRLRTFTLEDGVPGFSETVRVNLSVGEHCCVLYLRWPAGEVGRREAVEEFLAALEPLPATTGT